MLVISMEHEAEYTLIPYEKISSEALNQILSEYIAREGTDYGLVEFSHEEKKERLYKQIHAGEVLIVFESESESVTLISAQQYGRIK